MKNNGNTRNWHNSTLEINICMSNKAIKYCIQIYILTNPHNKNNFIKMKNYI